jgi:hypothetical protein
VRPWPVRSRPSRAARLTAPALLAGSLFAGVLAQVPAHADDWCFDDPIVSVQGHLLDIRTSLPVANVITMRNTVVTVVIPSNVHGAVLVNNVSAFPMTTTISASGPAWSGAGGIPVSVQALVTADVSFPVVLIVTPLGSALPLSALGDPATTSGVTNATLNVAMSLTQ